jgi:hypothetical protein
LLPVQPTPLITSHDTVAVEPDAVVGQYDSAAQAG